MPEVETDNSRKLLELAAKWMRKRRWHELLGKHGQYSQSLLHHIFAQLNLLVAIRPLLCDRSGFGLSGEQFLALFVGNLCHDVGKEAEAWQEAVRKGTRPPDHVHHEETQRAVEEWSDLLVDAEHRNGFMAAALAGVGLHHKATQGPASVLDQLLHGGHTDSRWRELADLVEAVDKICSAATVIGAADEADRKFGHGLPQRKFDVTFHRVQMLRGVSTTFLHRACLDAHVEKGWTPVLYFVDGSLYFALASTGVTVPSPGEIRAKIVVFLDELLQNANLPQQVVGNPTGDILPKPELFNPEKLEAYLTVAGQRSKPINFRKKYGRKRDGKFSEEFQGTPNKKGTLQKYCELKNVATPEASADQDRIFERFVTAVPLDGMFRFFKAVVLGDKLISEDNWSLTKAELKGVEEIVAKTKGDEKRKEEAREKGLSKAKKAALEHWLQILKDEYEKEFGKGSFSDLSSVTNDPARNLTKAVDYFLEQEVPNEGVRWLSKPTTQQQTELICRFSSIFGSAMTKLPEGVLPLPLDGNRLAAVFLSDLLLPGLVPSSNVAAHLDGYLRAKNGQENVLFCPWSNEAGQGVPGTGSDFGVATDGHSNRLPMQDKTWKNRGGVAMALPSRYELMLRRLLLGGPSKQLIVLIPPVQVGFLEGRRVVDAVGQLEQEVMLYSGEYSPNPTRRFSFGLTDQIATAWKSVEDSSLSKLLTYTSAPKTAKEHRKNLDNGLRQAFGPSDANDELSDFNGKHRKAFKSWVEAKEDSQLKEEAEDEILGLTLSSFNEECSTSFNTWEELIESIYLGHSDQAKVALANSEEVRERRKQALRFREPGRFVCQTPNLVLLLLPEEIRQKRKDDPSKKESESNGAIRQFFLSLVFADTLGFSVAIIDSDDALSFSGGEGSVFIPRNAALRSQVGRVRKNWATTRKSVGVPPTHEWLLPQEAEPWLRVLTAVHYLAGHHLDQKKETTLFPANSALYDVLSARSAGFLARRIENKAKRPVWSEEFQTLEVLEPFLG